MKNNAKKELWTEEELTLLKEHYTLGGYTKMKELGVNRSKLAIASKAQALGIPKKLENVCSWTEEEVKLLVESFKKGGLKGAVNSGIAKNPTAIKNKARKIGLTGTENEGVLWNSQREEILLKYYPKEGVQGVRMRGIKESKDIILSKALELGLGVKFE